MKTKSFTTKSLIGVAALATMFAACGDDNTTINQTGVNQVKSLRNYPCTDENVGEIVLATESSEVFFCTDGEWITMKGETGARGAQGKQGAAGENGADGKSAYQSWLDSGNTGTESDFIASLKGAKGEQGVPGEKGGSTTTSGNVTNNYYTSEYDGALGQFVDKRDGNVYRTTSVKTADGVRTWLAENLKYAVASFDGSKKNLYSTNFSCDNGRSSIAIASVSEKSVEGGLSIPAGCEEGGHVVYNFEQAKVACPSGWSLPTQNDWKNLIDAAGGEEVAGANLKYSHGIFEDAGESWGEDDAFNYFAFSVKPNNVLDASDKLVFNTNDGARFWTNNQKNTKGNVITFYQGAPEVVFEDDAVFKSSFVSVRCIKDVE